ncbi:MAG TPA: hypothetical protein VGH44_06260 [Candidatus Saccharimonadia bacterium]|jgi:hypothetical protein
MHTEIEVKFLDINLDDTRHQSHRLGAELMIPERLMRRINFESEALTHKNAWVRVRDENNRIKTNKQS